MYASAEERERERERASEGRCLEPFASRAESGAESSERCFRERLGGGDELGAETAGAETAPVSLSASASRPHTRMRLARACMGALVFFPLARLCEGRGHREVDGTVALCSCRPPKKLLHPFISAQRGRDAGFVAMHAALASTIVDLVMIPEARHAMGGQGRPGEARE